jgi:hypothetical protein
MRFIATLERKQDTIADPPTNERREVEFDSIYDAHPALQRYNSRCASATAHADERIREIRRVA